MGEIARSALGTEEILELTGEYSQMNARLDSVVDAADPLDAIVRVAIDCIADAEFASITDLRGERFRTAAATDERARRFDDAQHELRAGPCVDLLYEGANGGTNSSPDITDDARWPRLGASAAELGIGSVLSFRLRRPDRDDTVSALNMSALRPAAFGEEDYVRGFILASHAALALAAHAARTEAAQLRAGLQSNREIGVAMGILMAQHKITRDQAFDLLVLASQHANRKLRDIATDVADTGVLSLPRPPRRRGGR